MTTAVRIDYLASFGMWGGSDSQFDRPCGITTDALLNIYVADAGNHRIQKFDQHGTFLMKFGRGEGGWFKKVGKLANPTGVAVDTAGNSYVADVMLNCIHKFDAQGRFVMKFGKRGKGDAKFRRCRSVHLHAQGCLWVVDAYNDRIQKFDQHGTFLMKFGRGEGGWFKKVGKLANPSDLAFDQEGCIYVTDSKNNRVQKFDPQGHFLLKFGKTGTGDGELIHPRGIIIDGEGRVYVVDTLNHRVQVFNTEGVFLSKFGSQFGTPGKKEGQFNNPYGITINKRGDILVTDNANHRIQIFRIG